jgi:4-coumarate--CoA ligase
VVYIAIIGARGCFVGSNPVYTTLELGHLFSVSNVKFLIVQQESIDSDSVLPAANEYGIPFSNIFRFDPYGTEPEWLCSFVTLNRLLDYGHSYWHTFGDETESRTTTAALMSTSGTTRLPKAAAISHFAFVAQNTLLYDSKDRQYRVRIASLRV